MRPLAAKQLTIQALPCCAEPGLSATHWNYASFELQQHVLPQPLA